MASSSEAVVSAVFTAGLGRLVTARADLSSDDALAGATGASIGTVWAIAMAGAAAGLIRLSAGSSLTFWPAAAVTVAAGFGATDATSGFVGSGGVTASDVGAVTALADASTGKDETPDPLAVVGESGSADAAATIDSGVAVDRGLSETDVLAASTGPGFAPTGVTGAAVFVVPAGVALAALIDGFGVALALAGDAGIGASVDGLARSSLATAVAVSRMGAAAGDFTAAAAGPVALASTAGDDFSATAVGSVDCAASGVRSGEGGCATAGVDGSFAATEIGFTATTGDLAAARAWRGLAASADAGVAGVLVTTLACASDAVLAAAVAITGAAGFDGAAGVATSTLACTGLAGSPGTGLVGAMVVATAGAAATGLIDVAGAAALRTGGGFAITFGVFAGGLTGDIGSWLADASPASSDGDLVAACAGVFASACGTASFAGSGAVAGFTTTAAAATGFALTGAAALTSLCATAALAGGALAGGPIGDIGSWLAGVSPASKDGALAAVAGVFTSACRSAGLAGSGAAAGLTATAVVAGAGFAWTGAAGLTPLWATAGL